MRERVARAVCVGMVLLTDTHTHTLLYTHCSPARTSRERGVSERGCREERDREKEEREREAEGGESGVMSESEGEIMTGKVGERKTNKDEERGEENEKKDEKKRKRMGE